MPLSAPPLFAVDGLRCFEVRADGVRGREWLRLGVVHGNLRAERFWDALGYVEARTRQGVELGKLVNTVRVMVKPLAGGTLARYLTLVGRDRPDPADAP